MKYIISTQRLDADTHEVFFTQFSENIVHRHMFGFVRQFCLRAYRNRENFVMPRSAGFIDINGNFHGESESLNLKSKGQWDKDMIRALSFGNNNWRITEEVFRNHWPEAIKEK